jgi:hypothetical protein
MIAYQCSHAQDYVVTIKNDTLAGELKPLLFGPEKKLQVTETNKKKTVLPIFQVKSYWLKGEMYEPVKGPSGYTFMKVLKSGYLSLYAFQLENQLSYDGLFLQKKDGTSVEVPNLSFKKVLKNFLSDCAPVSNKIDEGTFNKRDLHQIVDEYNACIDSRTVDHTQAIAHDHEKTIKISSWDTLEDKVKAEPEFEGKANALEMISEIKSKIARSEKIPNFLVQGLKSSLTESKFEKELEAALKEIN